MVLWAARVFGCSGRVLGFSGFPSGPAALAVLGPSAGHGKKGRQERTSDWPVVSHHVPCCIHTGNDDFDMKHMIHNDNDDAAVNL